MILDYLKIDDNRSKIIFLLCMVILIVIPVYWFFFVPPAMDLQEINQGTFNASGYFAPGGYFSLEIDLDKESIQGYHNGMLSIIPNITGARNGTIWQPMEFRVDQWPGSKEEIKYSSNMPLNTRMVLNIKKVDIPSQSELKGQTIPLYIKYQVNYPVQTINTEVLGGTVTNPGIKTETVERTIHIPLDNKMITPRDLEAINMNESWKKAFSLVIWIIDLIFILFIYTKFEVIDNIKASFTRNIKRVRERLVELFKNIKV